mmetsp:Transcript_64178/g.144762  ORF Transcript_64178/g.144762 Transcript_64178/m.144762 type:complete len:102 (+) Transcript_64178:185-490(+)|eukprot:CAMPEP_0172593510 /NCGR_PEP_ID=MMETSP1068-20121228/12721_1 /TAXON_ID=35684 /ORGANISM="Pseudopedinella elastica, Strain CCMP716" /LENGTH=101 /DNA_ID=CAMNT_0013391073 /DNA_START=184 /DNA_END=489 /DNA_ORIENTATION=+
MSDKAPSESTEEVTRRQAGLAMSDCLFGQYYGTVGMLFGVGLPVSIRLKNYWPAMTAGLVGTLADFAYGYTVACKDQVAAFKLASQTGMPKISTGQPKNDE